MSARGERKPPGMAPRAGRTPGTATLSVREFKRGLKGSYRAHQALQCAVLKLLAIHNVPARHIHTGPRVAPRAGGGFELRGNRAQRGVPDVMGSIPPYGRLLLIELKTGGARRSSEQVSVQEEFQESGALCLVIRDVLELEPHLPPLRKPTERR